MLAEWRLLRDEIYEARHHFAVEEALARLVDEGLSPPTLRLRQVHPAVFVGVHQNTWTEVDVNYCQSNDIQIVRRMNGGGAVYHEMGSFCFSAFFLRNFLDLSEVQLYQLFSIPVIRTCADYGIVAHHEGRNDVLVGNRKIYGSAYFSWYSAFVQSGTFLVNMNFEVMERALTPPALKFTGKSTQSIHDRVTSLSREVGRELDTNEVIACFKHHFANVLEIQLKPGDLSLKEKELASNLLVAKYSNDNWNFGSKLEFQITVADRSDAGVISLSADMEGTKIQRARITGDILLDYRQDLDNLEKLLEGCSIYEARAIVQAVSMTDSLCGSILRLFEKLEQETIAISSKRI